MIVRLTCIPFFILVVMFVFEFIMQVAHPDETVWESYFSTIIFSTITGTIAAFFVLRKYRLLDARIVDEVGKRREVELENESYRRNLEAIFNSVQDAIITVDESFLILEINETATGMCGFSRNARGKKLEGFAEGCNLRCAEALHATLASRCPTRLQNVECQRKDGRRVVDVSAYPLLDASGVFEGSVMVLKDKTLLSDLEQKIQTWRHCHEIVGQSPAIRQVYSMIEALRNVDSTVLISGESGTGKELVVDAIHHTGNRRGKPLVKVNCSALPETLLESELFGHARGAFTGAVKDKIGRFELANGGTIFLDEIGDLSPKTQLELLRVLQEREFERVGDNTSIKVDVQVITATNRNLQELVRLGKFREDLYYRLKVVEIVVPSLRERREDIPVLVNHFLKLFSRRFEKQITSISNDVGNAFLEHPWPGNVRQLEHTLEHAFVVCRNSIITMDTLPADFCTVVSRGIPNIGNGGCSPERIREALEKTNWNKAKAARLLGINRRTLYRKMDQLTIFPQKAAAEPHHQR